MTQNNHQLLIIELVTYDFCVKQRMEVSNQYNHSNFAIYFHDQIVQKCSTE